MISKYAIGAYTERPGLVHPGKGIKILSLNEEEGHLCQVSCLGGVKNPSYLAYIPEDHLLFATAEADGGVGCVCNFSVNSGETLYELSQVNGPGKSNCHISTALARGMVFATSYGEGRFKAYSYGEKGIGTNIHDHSYKGSGPNEARQEGSHAHQSVLSPCGNYLYVVDLGGDSIWIHTLSNLADDPVKVAVPSGLGPRHLAFYQDRVAYVVCELIPTVLAFNWSQETGGLELFQQVPSVDEKDKVPAQPAAIKIHPSGKTLAVSNRFVDTITIFFIDQETKVLTRVDLFESRGKEARDITFSSSGRWLLMAHQTTCNIELREFDPQTGLPKERWGEPFSAGSPTCVVELTDE